MPASLIGERKLIIQEMTGQKRELVLTGRSMPHAPAAFGGGDQRKNVTFYPGNPNASVQLYGVEEKQSSWKGKWSDRFLTLDGKVLLDNYPLVRAKEVFETFDSFRYSLQQLRVNWAGIERYGFLDSFAAEWRTLAECYWSAQFSWISRVETADPPFLLAVSESDAGPSLLDFTKKMITKAIELLRKVFETEDKYIMETVRELEDVIRIAEVIASLGVEVGEAGAEAAERAAELAFTGYQSAMNIACQARAIALLDNASYMGWLFGLGSRHEAPPGPTALSGAASQAGLHAGRMGSGLTAADVAGAKDIGDRSRFPGQGGISRPGKTQRAWHRPEDSGMTFGRLTDVNPQMSREGQNPAAYLRKLVDKDEAAESILQVAHRLKQTSNRLNALVKPKTKNYHVVQQGEDLRHISVKYYGTANRWSDIAKQNGLADSAPPAGTRLVIVQ
ncbi:MAG: LysM domain-containing protein [Myxococcales bacterium]|nr:MAG: LysM domain-containing protein [Myxococcales bacterium]